MRQFMGIKRPKQKAITINAYNKIMAKISKEDLPVHEILIKMLEEAGKYRIKGAVNE